MREWFYYKVDMKKYPKMKIGVMRPLKSSFKLNKPVYSVSGAAQTMMITFSIVASYMQTYDLVQEHITYRPFLVKSSWEMSNLRMKII